jgi:SAM-dependent methyltransferase
VNWKRKAFIQKLVSKLPASLSHNLYYWLQRNKGALRSIDPFYDLEKSIAIVKLIKESGLQVDDKNFFEIGTGRNLNTPIGLWLCGASKVVTVDLNPYLKEELVIESIASICKNKHKIIDSFKRYAQENEIEKKLSILSNVNDLDTFLKEVNIEYIAPADASFLNLQDNVIDYHYSVNTLEHIPENTIISIFLEAKRILKNNGHAVHMIDLTDHFSHGDKNITSINFLQFSEKRWNSISGNRFMYHNRIRAEQYRELFENTGIKLIHSEELIDEKAVALLNSGFNVDDEFKNSEATMLAVSRMNFIGTFNPNHLSASDQGSQ